MAHIDGFRGADLLVGLALGDAFGAPVEFDRPDAIAPLREHLATFPGGGTFNWSPGEFTDDTQMALVLARHLLEQGHIEHQLLAESFAAWAVDSADVGIQTRSVLTSVRQGRTWREAVAVLDADAAGNGSLMRVAPVVLVARSREEAISLANEQSRVTHPNPLCRDACRVYIALLWDVLTGVPQTLDAYASTATTPEVGAAVRAAETEEPPRMSGFVLHTLTGSLWAVRGADSFADAVWRATSLGRDADTVAAVAGALAAATFTGTQGIPDEWRVHITSRHPLFKGWSAGDLTALAEALMERGSSPA